MNYYLITDTIYTYRVIYFLTRTIHYQILCLCKFVNNMKSGLLYLIGSINYNL